MTAHGRFDRIQPRLPALLDEVALPRTPDYVDELLARTAATRQRPRWTILERWLPMGVIARDRALVPPIPWRAVALAAALLLLLAAALVIVGTQRRELPAPFGPAANGILVQDGRGDIFVRDTLTSPQRLIVGGPENDFAPGFTRNGTQISFLRVQEEVPGLRPDVLSVMVANPDGTDVRLLAGDLQAPDWFDWSPDDREFVLQKTVAGSAGLYLIDTASGDTRPLVTDKPAYTPSWRGPDGREIIYRGWVRDGSVSQVALMAVRPDGSGNRILAAPISDVVQGYNYPQVSPDGRFVAYNGFDEVGRFRTHLLELDTGTIKVLDFGPKVVHHGWASFSPDSQLLLFHSISDSSPEVQVMLAPVAGGAAVPVGPVYPILGDSARLQQGFSPDGTLVLIAEGHGFEIRKVEVANPGLGEVLPWEAESVPNWQRLPPRGG